MGCRVEGLAIDSLDPYTPNPPGVENHKVQRTHFTGTRNPKAVDPSVQGLQLGTISSGSVEG